MGERYYRGEILSVFDIGYIVYPDLLASKERKRRACDESERIRVWAKPVVYGDHSVPWLVAIFALHVRVAAAVMGLL